MRRLMTSLTWAPMVRMTGLVAVLLVVNWPLLKIFLGLLWGILNKWCLKILNKWCLKIVSHQALKLQLNLLWLWSRIPQTKPHSPIVTLQRGMMMKSEKCVLLWQHPGQRLRTRSVNWLPNSVMPKSYKLPRPLVLKFIQVYNSNIFYGSWDG